MGEEWLKRRLQERYTAEERRRIIDEGMDVLWQNLCAAIGRNLKAYQAATPGEIVEWSGPQPERIWAKVGSRDRSANVMTTLLRKLEVTFDREKTVVKFSRSDGGGVVGTIGIGVNDQNQPSFLDEKGEPIATEQAAETILDAFLFDVKKS